MKRIVVGFDGTEQAKDALHLGAAVAAAFDAELIVASALEFAPLEIDLTGYEKTKVEHFSRVFSQAHAELGDAEFETRELQDSTAHGLTDLAENEGLDLIVVGSTHHGPIGRVLAGTVASALLHGAPCGVMVAARGWGEHEHAGFGLVGVGYDGSDESSAALRRAAGVAQVLGAKLRVITIVPYISGDAEFGPVEAMREMWAARLDEAVGSIAGEVETETVLRQGREATELALQGVDLDLLVVGSRGYGPLRRTLVGSTSTELVRTAPCPVLVLPRGAADTDARAEPEADVA